MRTASRIRFAKDFYQAVRSKKNTTNVYISSDLNTKPKFDSGKSTILTKGWIPKVMRIFNPSCPILDLPVEIHEEILRRLPYEDHYNAASVMPLWWEILQLQEFRSMRFSDEYTGMDNVCHFSMREPVIGPMAAHVNKYGWQCGHCHRFMRAVRRHKLFTRRDLLLCVSRRGKVTVKIYRPHIGDFEISNSPLLALDLMSMERKNRVIPEMENESGWGLGIQTIAGCGQHHLVRDHLENPRTFEGHDILGRVKLGKYNDNVPEFLNKVKSYMNGIVFADDPEAEAYSVLFDGRPNDTGDILISVYVQRQNPNKR
ncbi:hypothetical protein TWF694_000371 [Orbilia ellipsospora]|uniref:F-box domain-containing protein n=1 Tax=Orbilia ellipsospora TaxID=2528407 RepID=A0AAV9XNQ6_9PEZI